MLDVLSHIPQEPEIFQTLGRGKKNGRDIHAPAAGIIDRSERSLSQILVMWSRARDQLEKNLKEKQEAKARQWEIVMYLIEAEMQQYQLEFDALRDNVQSMEKRLKSSADWLRTSDESVTVHTRAGRFVAQRRALERARELIPELFDTLELTYN